MKISTEPKHKKNEEPKQRRETQSHSQKCLRWNPNPSRNKCNLLLSAAPPTATNIFWKGNHTVLIPALKYWLFCDMAIKVPLCFDLNGRYNPISTNCRANSVAEEALRHTIRSLLGLLVECERIQNNHPQWSA